MNTGGVGGGGGEVIEGDWSALADGANSQGTGASLIERGMEDILLKNMKIACGKWKLGGLEKKREKKKKELKAQQVGFHRVPEDNKRETPNRGTGS